MKRSETAKIPTRFGIFNMQVVKDIDGKDHFIFFKGTIKNRENVPIRIHSECLTSEVLGSLKCDCKEQLDFAMEYLSNQDFGAIIYLRQEGRGIGLYNKVEAYALQDVGYDTIEANHQLGFESDLRTYDLAVSIIKDLGIKSVQLMTNNPDKIAALRNHGIEISDNIPVRMEVNLYNEDYMKVKKLKMNHHF